MSFEYSEDTLVQKTTAECFRDELDWRTELAWDRERLGPDGTLGRQSRTEVVLIPTLRAKLMEFNPGLPDQAYHLAIQSITATSGAKSTLQLNQEKYKLFREGVLVEYQEADGTNQEARLQVFDFESATNNDFLAVRELWIKGRTYLRRADVIGFVNGIPLLFIELKAHYKDVATAYEENLRDYKGTIPHLFHYNAIILLSNGREGRFGSITSEYRHFNEWKRLHEEDPGVVDWQTMLRGLCRPSNFMDIFENYIVFDESGKEMAKIVSRNHQYLGVNRAVDAVQERKIRQGKLGVFWHTQGSGKSYSMVFLARKVHRKLEGNFTFLILTDRQELDRQIYKTFAGVSAATDIDCQATSGEHLKKLLQEDRRYIFSLIHKFNQDDDEPYTRDENIIVISDEAHRSQYGRLARTMRQMVPNASFIGFTGTPLIGTKEDEETKETFGDYISIYDFKRSVDDQATVPLYYDNRGEKLTITTPDINAAIEDSLEEYGLEEEDEERVRKRLGDKYTVLTAPDRLETIAIDLVQHYSQRWQTGKAMLVCVDKITAVKMYDYIMLEWNDAIRAQRRLVYQSNDEQAKVEAQAKLHWLEETEIRVVVSHEQGEVATFAEWGLEIEPHRRIMKERDLEEEFKDGTHPFRLVIVCAMWLTGFDVESLATLYVDKPMKSHTLMQAIARANRIAEGKPNGLIVDYNGILQSLRNALATYASWQAENPDEEGPTDDEIDPVASPEDRLAAYVEALDACVSYVADLGYDIDGMINATDGFSKIGELDKAVEAVTTNDRTRAEFDVRAKRLFDIARATVDMAQEQAPYKQQYNAIEAIHRDANKSTQKHSINRILADLHPQITSSIQVMHQERPDYDSGRLYDISEIDFQRLQEEFTRSTRRNVTVQSLREQVEQRLQRMVGINPSRMSLYDRYLAIIQRYNEETDAQVIQQTFDDLLNLVRTMSQEQERAVQEGLSEEQLAIYDLLRSGKELTRPLVKRVKQVAEELLFTINQEIAHIDRWTEKESTQAQIETLIKNFLWDENRGLPDPDYTVEDVERLSGRVFTYVVEQHRGHVGRVA